MKKGDKYYCQKKIKAEKKSRALGCKKETIYNFNLGGRVGLFEKVTFGWT